MHRCKLTTFASVLLLIWPIGLFGAGEASLRGHWEGAIEIPGNELEFDLDFEPSQGGWKGDISIPAQNAKDLPLIDITLEGDQASFKIRGIPGEPTFNGKIAGDEISGDFTQGGRTFAFNATRGENLSAKARQALEGFDAFVEKALADWKGVGVAVGIVAGDEVVYAKGFGERNREEGLPVTLDTLFAIGSSSKAFTTFAMGVLVDEGKLDWDEPVSEYLPEWRLYDDHASLHVTPRDMVSHRTGLPRHDLVWYNNLELTREEILHRLQYLPPNKGLREVWQYNNLMFVMAGYLVGQMRGQTWEEAVRDLVLEPLGMDNTNFSVEASRESDDYAIPYQVHDEEIERMNFRDISNVGPAGSINSSVNDMLRWVRVHLNKGKIGGRQLIQPDTLREMHSPQMAIPGLPDEPLVSPSSYGLGWMLTTYQGKYRVAHGGNIDGFSAGVTLYPFEKLGIVVFANQNGSALPGVVTRQATELVLGLEANDWYAKALENRDEALKLQKESETKKETVRVKGTQPSHPLEDYAGEYSHPGYGVLKVEHQDGGLSFSYNGISTKLRHWHYDVFNGLENPDDRTFENRKLQFGTNLKGDIETVRAPFEPTVDPITFTRQAESGLYDPAYLARFEGTYKLGPRKIRIAVKGDHLTASISGQPTYTLEPYRGTEFNLEGLSGYSVEFKVDPESEIATEAIFKQPNGVFTATRAEAEPRP